MIGYFINGLYFLISFILATIIKDIDKFFESSFLFFFTSIYLIIIKIHDYFSKNEPTIEGSFWFPFLMMIWFSLWKWLQFNIYIYAVIMFLSCLFIVTYFAKFTHDRE